MIASNIAEDTDSQEYDQYAWDMTSLARGAYYFYAIISDGSTNSTAYLPGRITIGEQRDELQ